MRDAVEKYYGKILSSSGDLKTSACTTSSAPASNVRTLIDNVHPEVRERYYGCGLVFPTTLSGCRVLDIGCGSGRDCYVLAQLVGPNGSVLGVDMTDEQLAVAEKHRQWHARAFGYNRPNVEFHKGYIEELDRLELELNSFDVIVSNCVINLSTDKPAVLRAAHGLLKDGGELYFSDVYASRRVPASVSSDPELYGECLGGALYWNDFEQLARECGFTDPRLVEDAPIAITSPRIAHKVEGIDFFSATYRLFKLPDLEPGRQDYGQAVSYRGTIEDSAASFLLDKEHNIEKGRVVPVCGNTWRMLQSTRLAPHFEFLGDFSKHFGIFNAAGSNIPFDASTAVVPATATSSCC
ncbi:MAG: methyltransferase domain-containing protein [Gammaproteobacteria bacterium]